MYYIALPRKSATYATETGWIPQHEESMKYYLYINTYKNYGGCKLYCYSNMHQGRQSKLWR